MANERKERQRNGKKNVVKPNSSTFYIHLNLSTES